MRTNEELILFFNKEIQDLNEEIKKREVKHKEQIQHLNYRHKKELEETIDYFQKIISSYEQRIEELESLLKTDSTNSSLPPSTDKFKKKKKQKEKSPNEYNSRPKTDRKKGGQKGHAGKTLTKKQAQQLIEDGKATERIIDLGDPNARIIGERYIFDVEITKIINKVQIHEGTNTSGFPRTGCYYGERIKAIAVMLFAEGNMSVDKVASIIGELTENDYPVSPGFIYRTLKEFARLAEEFNKQNLRELERRKTLYTDSTSMPVNGKNKYVRNISSGDIVVYVPHNSKRKAELFEMPVLPTYTGNLVHDHETALYNLKVCKHFECGIHLIRRLRKSAEDTGNTWQNKMILRLTEANNELSGEKCALSREELDELSKSYDEILELGYEENKQTSCKTFRSSEKSFLNDLKKYKRNYLGFASVPEVDFTNNQSERDLRKIVCRRKVITGLREFSGLEMTCSILSMTETLKKQEKPLLKELKKNRR